MIVNDGYKYMVEDTRGNLMASVTIENEKIRDFVDLIKNQHQDQVVCAHNLGVREGKKMAKLQILDRIKNI